MRAGRISVSRIDAGSGAPCSCSIASSSASAPCRRLHDALPGGREPSEHGLIDRLDLVPQLGERAAPQHAQHAGVGPLAPRAAGPELAFDQAPLGREAHQHGFGGRHAEAVARREVRRGERRVRARVAQRQVAERIADRLEQRLGNADRQRHAERVAEARGVLDRDEARLAGDADRQHAARGDQRADAGGDVGGQRSLADLGLGEIAERQQHVVHAVGALDVVLRIEPLQLALDRVHRLGVEQLAQLRVAEQLAQLRLIDGQRLRAALGQRRVAVVDEAGDVAEEQRRGKRRRRLGIDRRDADLPAADVAERRDERRHVEEVAQALAVGLEQHGKRSVARRDRQQIGGALALLPERRALPGRRLGSSSERAAFSRNFAANSAVAPSCRTTSACTSSGSGSSSRGSGGWSTSGNRTTNPSSPHSVSTSAPVSSRIFAATAIAHGAWMRPPRGESTQTRQSPSSSRTRSMTIVFASGTARAAAS